MFGARNQQLAASNPHAEIALILIFFHWEKEPIVQDYRVCRSSLSLRERARVRVIGVLI